MNSSTASGDGRYVADVMPSEFSGLGASVGYFALGNAALAAGDVATALDATTAAWEHGNFAPGLRDTADSRGFVRLSQQRSRALDARQ